MSISFPLGTALAGTLGAAIAVASPLAAQAQTAPRAAATRAMSATAAPVPGADLLSSLRQSAPAAAAVTATATLSYPYGITVDNSDNIYVTNLFGGVNVYNRSYGLTGSITAGVSFPAAVAVSFSGNIYVANNGGNNITIYNPSLVQVGTISDATLVNPSAMYIDGADDVWALDAGGTLHGYLSDGTVLPATHTGGTAVGPWGPNVTVWGVANASGSFDEYFENVSQAVHDGPGLYNYFPAGSPEAGGVAEDQYGQQYVSDIQHNQVQIWSRDGVTQVGAISTPSAPSGVAVDQHLNRLYVVTMSTNEVDVYSTKAPFKLLHVIH